MRVIGIKIVLSMLVLVLLSAQTALEAISEGAFLGVALVMSICVFGIFACVFCVFKMYEEIFRRLKEQGRADTEE